jgi:hypothetical protein
MLVLYDVGREKLLWDNCTSTSSKAGRLKAKRKTRWLEENNKENSGRFGNCFHGSCFLFSSEGADHYPQGSRFSNALYRHKSSIEGNVENYTLKARDGLLPRARSNFLPLLAT